MYSRMKMLSNNWYKIVNRMIVEVMDFPTKKLHCKSTGDNEVNILPWIQTITASQYCTFLPRYIRYGFCPFSLWFFNSSRKNGSNDKQLDYRCWPWNLDSISGGGGGYFGLFTPKTDFACRHTVFSKIKIKFHMYFMVSLAEIPPDYNRALHNL